MTTSTAAAMPPPKPFPWRAVVDVVQFAVFAAVVLWLIVRGAGMTGYAFQWYRVPQYLYRVIDGELIWGPLMRGLVVTLDIAFWSLILTVVIGLATALLKLSDSIVGRGLAAAYIEVIRNTPLLVQLYLFYFVLAPILGVDRYVTAILCLAVFEGAYAAEIFRAGIQSVGRGQWEAAASIGLTRGYAYRFIVLPQAIRVVLPPMTGQAVSLIKHSAIVSVIAIFDLTNEGRNVIADTFMTFEIWLTVAAMYLVVTITLSGFVTWLEHRLKTPA